EHLGLPLGQARPVASGGLGRHPPGLAEHQAGEPGRETRGAGGGLAHRPPHGYSPSTGPASPGVNTASPAAVWRTASTSSVADADLTRQPDAPAFTASSTSACSPLADSTSTRVRGSAPVTRRMASTPDTLPRLRSISTTSGATV